MVLYKLPPYILRGYFGMKQSPRSTALSPPSRSDVLSAIAYMKESIRLDVSELACLLSVPLSIRRTPHHLKVPHVPQKAKWIMKSIISRHVETTADFTCVTCQKVRLTCSQGLKRCFEDFVSTRNSLWILNPIFVDLESHLAQLATEALLTSVTGARSICSNPDCLQTVLPGLNCL